jgi:hypothetical protein
MRALRLSRAMRRKIEDERDARACLKATKAAGVSVKDWARAHGVDARSLHMWQVNLARWREAPPKPAELRLVELVPTDAARRSASYLVRVAGAEIEVDGDFHAETLVRLVRALRAC